MNKSDLKRFVSHLLVVDGCWLMSASDNGRGYQIVCVNKQAALAHRAAYEHWVEKIPADHDIHHLCPHKNCVNPSHLKCVPADEHPDDITFLNRLKTHCIHGHSLADCYTHGGRGRKSRGRKCRTCTLLYTQRKKEKDNATH